MSCLVYTKVHTKQAQRDAKKLSSSSLKPKAEELLATIAESSYCKPPPFAKSLSATRRTASGPTPAKFRRVRECNLTANINAVTQTRPAL